MWSSARAHLGQGSDGVTDISGLAGLVGDWRAFLAEQLSDDMLETIRKGERTGRPLGDADFVRRLEGSTGRSLARQKPGPKPRSVAEEL